MVLKWVQSSLLCLREWSDSILGFREQGIRGTANRASTSDLRSRSPFKARTKAMPAIVAVSGVSLPAFEASLVRASLDPSGATAKLMPFKTSGGVGLVGVGGARVEWWAPRAW